MSFNSALTYQEIRHLASFTEAAEQVNLESISSPEEPIIMGDNIVSETHLETKKRYDRFFSFR